MGIYGCDSITTLKLIVLQDATPVGTTSDDVEVTTEENKAVITWPQVTDAFTYELIIRDKQGNIVCSLEFNSEGVLLSIDFYASSRNRSSQTTGFSFIVTGLNMNEGYTYTLTPKTEDGNELEKFEGSFQTTVDTPTLLTTPDYYRNQQPVKVMDNGIMKIIMEDGRVYDVVGTLVK